MIIWKQLAVGIEILTFDFEVKIREIYLSTNAAANTEFVFDKSSLQFVNWNFSGFKIQTASNSAFRICNIDTNVKSITITASQISLVNFIYDYAN